MFSLDDFTDDCEPFFESEEDDLSSGENSRYSVRAITSAYLNLLFLHLNFAQDSRGHEGFVFMEERKMPDMSQR